MDNRRFGEKSFYSFDDPPHSKPMADPEEGSTPKAEMPDEGQPDNPSTFSLDITPCASFQ